MKSGDFYYFGLCNIKRKKLTTLFHEKKTVFIWFVLFFLSGNNNILRLKSPMSCGRLVSGKICGDHTFEFHWHLEMSEVKIKIVVFARNK